MMPQRIQRKRTKGWRMPENTVYVGRPGIFGSPFAWLGLEESLVAYRIAANGGFDPAPFQHYSDSKFHLVYEDVAKWQHRLGEHPRTAIRMYLEGKDLACWCPVDQPCHADILLEIANS